MSLIEIKNITKRYGKMTALDNVTASLEADRIYGLLGRNGAGKTTLINIITNRIFADSGEVTIDSENAADNERAQAKLYYMTEHNVHPSRMKVKDAFKWAGEFHPAFDEAYAVSLAEQFKLDTEKKIRKLSSGYNTVCKLILTMASGAPVMIFDEPVSGLDAVHRELFYKLLLKHYSEHSGTIIVSTHLIDEVTDILEHVIILKEGRIILALPVESVLHSTYSVSGDAAGVDTYIQNRNIIFEEMIGNLKIATVFDRHDRKDKQKINELGLQTSPARLQEVFISLTS